MSIQMDVDDPEEVSTAPQSLKIELSGPEFALCIGALELGVKELREGEVAAQKLNMPLPDLLSQVADQMEALKGRLLTIASTHG